MGAPTIDQRNPGRLQPKRFAPRGGLDGSKADHEVKEIGFKILKNCLVDKRLGAVVKRPGSITEVVTGLALGLPLGTGEYTSPSVGVMPVDRTLLHNFGGISWYQQSAGVYSAVVYSLRCQFATSRQTQFAKVGNTLAIAGGLPAFWKGPGETIDRMGIVPPTGIITVTSVNTGSGVTLNTGGMYMYTYFDSVSGLESDWSNLSAITGAVANKSIVIAIPAATAANWDKIRIYRTLDGGQFPYLVDTVPAGTTSYTDSTRDSLLTAAAEDRYVRAVPPSTSFITATYAQCIWFVDGSNPYVLRFSKPYVGSDVDVQYYPVDNYVISNQPITGLLVTPGKMLVFHPRSISYVSGFSNDDFAFQPLISGVGTVFPNSIATNGKEVFMLAEEGVVSLPMQGGEQRHLSREIDEDLQPLLAASYNAAIYVSACWNPSLRQFILMVNAQSTSSALWEEVGSGSTASAVAGWQTPALVDETWEYVGTVGTPTAAMKVRIWGMSPELSAGPENTWMEYEFPTITNDNVVGAYPTFVFHPQPSSDTADPQQDKTILGLWTGTEGKIRTIFRRDKATDDGAVITALIITERIRPGTEMGEKLFHSLGFDNSYSDATADGTGTFQYLLDFDDPQIRSYTSSLKSFVSGSTDLKKFTSMQGKHIHLVLTDISQSLTKILLGEFFINFRERQRRSTR